MAKFRVYVGTFTFGRSLSVGPEQGIFWYQFDTENGQLALEGSADAGPNPGFLTLSPDHAFLYSVNEVKEFHGQKGGGLSAFAVEPGSGKLTFLNSQPTFGVSPCYVSLDHTGRWAMVSNYMGGNVAVYPLLAGGYLGPNSEFVQHEGHGPNPQRQEGPHAHSIQVDPSNRRVLVADLGLDQVKLYQLDPVAGKLHPSVPVAIQVHAGAGPRHLCFHPNGRWLYVINELDSTLDVFEVAADGGFTHLQTISSLPVDYSGEKWAADIHVHPNGKLLFASNRAHDSLAGFAIDPADGRVRLVSVTSSGGKTPRNFAIDPSGHWVLAANQNGDNLVVFAVDAETGQLTAAGIEVQVPTPVCVRFVV